MDYTQDLSPVDRLREEYVLLWLDSERRRKHLQAELSIQAALAPHLKKGVERLEDLRERHWDQSFPWDFHQRVYESTLSDEELEKLQKSRVLTGAAALYALYNRMSKSGEL